jgi:hypothetical protein
MPQWTLFENDFRVIDQTLDDLIARTGAILGPPRGTAPAS